MSRIGRLPVAIPAGVEVTVAEGNAIGNCSQRSYDRFHCKCGNQTGASDTV